MSACLCCNKTHKSCRYGRHDQPDGEMCYRHQLERKVWELSDNPLSDEFQAVAVKLDRLENPFITATAGIRRRMEARWSNG